MSRLFILSIVDKRGEQFGPLYLVKNLNAGARTFADSLRGGDSMMLQHPDDFALVQVGYFDDETGMLDAVEGPIVVLEASEAIRRLSQPAELTDVDRLTNGEEVSDGVSQS